MSNQNSGSQEAQTASESRGSTVITWDLKSCNRRKKSLTNVVCTFSISPSEDINDYGVTLTRDDANILVDGSGNVYKMKSVQAMNHTEVLTGYGMYLGLNLAKGIAYKVTIDFADVPTSISQVPLLQVGSRYSVIKFHDVKIN